MQDALVVVARAALDHHVGPKPPYPALHAEVAEAVANESAALRKRLEELRKMPITEIWRRELGDLSRVPL